MLSVQGMPGMMGNQMMGMQGMAGMSMAGKFRYNITILSMKSWTLSLLYYY